MCGDVRTDRWRHGGRSCTFPERGFAFDEFGPLGIRSAVGSGWAEQKHPDRLPATCHRTHGVGYFRGCYSVGDDRLWGIIRRWAMKHKVELCCTPTYASWANPIEAHFGSPRQFTIAKSNHHDHTGRTRTPHAYLRRRNADARHRDVLAAECKERARVRSEKGIRWGGRPLIAAVRSTWRI